MDHRNPAAHRRRHLFAMTFVSKTVPTVVVTVSTLAATPCSASAQVACHDIEFSTVPMQRNAALLRAGADLTSVIVDEVADRIKPQVLTAETRSGLIVRLAKLWAIDLPLASITQVANHEWGHATRIVEAGTNYRVHIDDLPWPMPFASASVTPQSSSIGNRAGIIGGGLEASHTLADLIVRNMYAGCDGVRYSDVALFVYAKLDATAYSLTDLRERHLASPEALFNAPGDPRQYAVQLSSLRYGFNSTFPRIQDAAREIRKASLLNLVDYALVGNARLLWIEYVMRGHRAFRPARIQVGRFAIVPRLKYGFSPFGPEYAARTEFTGGGYSGGVQVRWTKQLQGRRLVGLGAETARRFPRVSVRLSGDVWKERDGRRGARVEGTIGTASPQINAWTTIGGKSSGYLAGYPSAKTLYAAFGGSAKF